MKENQNIDELLNSFIDGELGPREQTEVQRLITNDADAAKRLRDLQKCRQLVVALPVEEAPAQIGEDIKAALERKTLLGARHADYDERKGALHLFVRKFIAAAAMFLLVVALGAVVYMIVSPGDTKHKKVAVDKWRQPAKKVVVQKSVVKQVKPAAPVSPSRVVVTAEKPAAKTVETPVVKPQEPQIAFNGKVELKVSDVAAADATISRTLEDNGLLSQTGPIEAGRKIYSINCSRETLKSFLDQLKGVWNRFDSTRLLVDGKIAVDDVTAEQILSIAAQSSEQNQMQIAKNFAAFNNMNQRLPGKEVLTAVNDKQDDLANIPKPVLTSKEKAKEVAANEDGKTVHLTIVIMPNK